MKNHNLLKAALCCFMIAATVFAQNITEHPDKAPPAPQAPAARVCPTNAACRPAVAKPKRKHHRTRTVLIIVGVAAVATAAAVVVALHKTSSAQHCNGPNPLTCSP
jgi:hypothetical protein